MFGCDRDGLVGSRSDQRSSCQVIGHPEESTRSLVDGGYRGHINYFLLQTGDGDMVVQVVFHPATPTAFLVASANDPRGERLCSSVHELVHSAAPLLSTTRL